MIEFIAEWGPPRGLDNAMAQADATAEIGATHAKWQLLTPETLASRHAARYWSGELGGVDSQLVMFRRGHHKLTAEEWRALFQRCRALNVIPTVTPFDLDAVATLEVAGVDAFKLASGDITYKALYEAVAATGKPVYFSTGAATEPEITRARDWLGLWRYDVVAMAGDLVYPCRTQDATPVQQLRDPALLLWRRGYSDHTRGIPTAAAAVACGATALEKHITLDPGGDTPDDRMALTVEEAKRYLALARHAEELCTESIGDPQAQARIGARRSAYAARLLPAGHILEESDIQWLRPAPSGSIPPTVDLPGQRLVDIIGHGEPITYASLAKK